MIEISLNANRRSTWGSERSTPGPALVVLRLRLALIWVLGAACLRVGAWAPLAVYGSLAIAWVFWLRVPARSLLGLLGAELVFLSLAALPHGWERASFLMARSLVCLLLMNGVLLTLPPHSLAIALKSLPLPAALRETALLAGQYLEIVIDEVQRMQRAAACRGLSGPGSWLRYVSAATIGSLYLRSLDRAERVYAAMVVRGYGGALPLLHPSPPHHRWWLWGAAVGAAGLAIGSYGFA
ncbi:energy-coupling factor transporter transmembrane component T [Limnothrix redekei LRLZ20PSL1]|uniref:Energy-coupling factor transporter transmembrane component T n=1 Tax=Limnothrix redekei LRLZ20PSL1 TaxID=3112953 RepID=A0ABW7C945_9CYAN